eukprot:SAG11_NODE_2386_length_3418_cov_1.215728_2_plen_146_part_00
MKVEAEPAAELNLEEPALQAAYSEALASLVSDEAHMGTESAETTSHYYGKNIAESPLTAATARIKMRRLMKEIKGLQVCVRMVYTECIDGSFLVCFGLHVPHTSASDPGDLVVRHKSVRTALIRATTRSRAAPRRHASSGRMQAA